MSLQHVYSQTVADGTATSVVRPSDWNSFHNQYLTLAGGNTAGQSTASGTNIVYSGGNNVTLSINQGAGEATVVFSGPNTFAQTVDTNKAGTGFTTTTAAGVLWSGTNDTNGLKFAMPAYLTTAMQSNASSTMAGTGFTTTTAGGAVIAATHDSAGLKLGVPAYITTGMLSNAGSNFVPVSTVTAGANAFSVSGTFASNGITLSAPAMMVTSERANYVQTANSSLFELSAQQTNYLQMGNSSSVYAGTNATITMYSNDLSISGIGGGVINQTGPNIAVAGSTVTAGTVLFSNSPTVTFGMAGSTVTASAAGGGGGVTLSFYEPSPVIGSAALTTTFFGQNSIHFVPIKPMNNVSATVINMFVSNAVTSAATASYARSMTFQYGIYSLGTGTQNTNLYTLGTSTLNVFFSGNSSNASCGLTIQGGGSTYTQTVASSSGATQWANNKIFQLPWAGSLAAGNEYYFAIAQSTATVGSSAGFIMNHMVMPGYVTANWGRMNPGNSATNLVATNASVIPNYAGFIYSAASAALPATIALSQRVTMASNAKMYVQFDA